MKRTAATLIPPLLALVVACGGEPGERDSGRLDAEERAAVQAAEALADSAEAALAPLPLFSAEDRRALRRHLNATHLASARKLGVGAVPDSSAVEELAAAGELVQLQDSTAHWVVRELEHSLPYVTPDAHAMLVEIGERFHARLDSLGVPRYRFEISSVLRTAGLQADLRRGNSNASRSTSSHEYATTVDLAYNRFSTPAAGAPEMRALIGQVAPDPDVRTLAVERAGSALQAVAEERDAELKAVLGEVLTEMQEEGTLRALHERAQPVYHITVASRLPARPAVSPVRASQ